MTSLPVLPGDGFIYTRMKAIIWATDGVSYPTQIGQKAGTALAELRRATDITHPILMGLRIASGRLAVSVTLPAVPPMVERPWLFLPNSLFKNPAMICPFSEHRSCRVYLLYGAGRGRLYHQPTTYKPLLLQTSPALQSVVSFKVENSAFLSVPFLTTCQPLPGTLLRSNSSILDTRTPASQRRTASTVSASLNCL